MTAAVPAIEIVGLQKAYGRGQKRTVAVDGLDLVVRRGEVFGLLGPNGAGKTTTVEICEGLTEPDAGRVRILGLAWGEGRDDEIRGRIGVCLQESRFHEHATVAEVLSLFASFFATGRPPVEVLRLVGLEEKASARQKSLSGGQRQRLAVATALLGDPAILFLDEPTTGLDPQSRRQLWDVVRNFRDGGGTVVLTTHYMDEAQQLCDRIAIVDRGRIIALGTPAELIHSLGAEHLIEVELEHAADESLLDAVRGLPDVAGVECRDRRLVATVRSVHTALPALLRELADRRHAVEGLATRHATLEDVFVQLTGRHLREDDA
jgi:ABC-2 type transport system ATP-binding protein